MLGPLRSVSSFLGRSKARFLVSAGASGAAITALVLVLVLLPSSKTAGRASATPPSSASVVQTSPTPSESPSPTETVSETTAPTTAPVTSPAVARPTPTYQTPEFAVGVTKIDIVDPSRSTEARGDAPASSSRAMTVTIRYPVSGSPSESEASDVSARAGAYPLVVFAHGYNVSAETYADLEHEVASAGFIVAAPDFPLTSSAIPGEPDENDVSNQAGDVSFVITTLLSASTVPSVLAGHVANTKVGVMGHSDGGITAAAVAYNSSAADPRIGAGVILSGEEADYPGSWFPAGSPPLLAIHGTADDINPYSNSEQIYDDAPGPKYFVSVQGGSHLGPFTSGSIRPAISTLIADFLAAELKHDAAAEARIPDDATVSVLQLTASSGA